MQVIRTLIWILILFILLAFSFFNWDPVEVTLWNNLVLETKVPALVIISFLLGLIPMWLIHRGTKWRLNRRIATLESAARSGALARHDPVSGTGSSAPSAATEPTPAPTGTDNAPSDDTLTPSKDGGH